MPHQNDDATEGIQERDLTRQRQQSANAPRIENCWAVIIGISKYQHEEWNLKYAHRDAEELSKLLQKSAYGPFSEENIKLLVDEEATTRNITKILRGDLTRPKENDLVLLYFSCHGVQDPRRPENMYFLTHDSEADNIGGTALPMSEVDVAVSTIHANNIIVLADTCHSAKIVPGTKGDMPERAKRVNEYLVERFGSTEKSISMLTSAEANEKSVEAGKWGGGHGVFTHFLLRGLEGKATEKDSRKVTVDSLFEYVRKEVLRETDSAQTPFRNGGLPIKGDLVLADFEKLHVKERVHLAGHLCNLAWKLGDMYTFELAAHQLEKTLDAAYGANRMCCLKQSIYLE